MPNTPQQATRKNHGRLSGRVVRPQMGGDNQGTWGLGVLPSPSSDEHSCGIGLLACWGARSTQARMPMLPWGHAKLGEGKTWDRFFAGMTIRIISARLATRAERREYEEGTL